MGFKNEGMFENFISVEKSPWTEGYYVGRRVIETTKDERFSVHCVVNAAGQFEEIFGGKVNAEKPGRVWKS